MGEPRITEDDGRWTATGPGYEVRVARPREGVVVVMPCDVEEGADIAPVAEAIRALFAGGDGLIVTWEGPRRDAVNTALLAAGCTVRHTKVFVRRDLTGDLPREIELDWRTLAETGEAELLRLLTEASEGDPFEEGERDPEREWEELKESTDGALDPTLWRVALVGGEPVGVVLPTAWLGEDPHGTLSYVGVLPAHRGKGLGRALHAAGLRLLRDAGARRYVGSTDVRNIPMARVFDRNGCTRAPLQLLLHPGDGRK